MKRTCIVLTMLLTVVCLTTSTALALQLIAEARIEATTGTPVKEDLTFLGQGFEDFGMNELFSVPFAYYAKWAENQLYINTKGNKL